MVTKKYVALTIPYVSLRQACTRNGFRIDGHAAAPGDSCNVCSIDCRRCEHLVDEPVVLCEECVVVERPCIVDTQLYQPAWPQRYPVRFEAESLLWCAASSYGQLHDRLSRNNLQDDVVATIRMADAARPSDLIYASFLDVGKRKRCLMEISLLSRRVLITQFGPRDAVPRGTVFGLMRRPAGRTLDAHAAAGVTIFAEALPPQTMRVPALDVPTILLAA